MAGAIIPVITPTKVPARGGPTAPLDLSCGAMRMSLLSIMKSFAAGVVAQKLVKAVG